MKKTSLTYRCTHCGHGEPKWLGRCPECGQWNSFRESASATSVEAAGESFPVPIESVDPAAGVRLSTGFAEFDRVLGGGMLRGSVILISGEPGIGKSTLLLQLCAKAGTKGKVLYVSGEESPAHIRLRADRTGCLRPGMELFCSGDLGRIRSVLDAVKPTFAVVDSLQTIVAEEAGAVPGTPAQVKYCVQELVQWAKRHDSCLILVAHVTKEGIIAGPKAAEHLVDVVLGFDQAEGDVRTLRAGKNRFGSTDEIGLFRMTAGGLAEVGDPSGFFLVNRTDGIPPGVAVAPVHEGSRILLVEIQALVVPAKAGLTRVYSERIDAARVSRVAAVLEKHTRIKFSDQDIYVNVAGGIKIAEPAIDLALACALCSARAGESLPPRTAFAGELSLAGEIRSVPYMRRRAKAASSLGFAELIGPAKGQISGNAHEDPASGAPSGTSSSAAAGHAGAEEWRALPDIKSVVAALWVPVARGGSTSRGE